MLLSCEPVTYFVQNKPSSNLKEEKEKKSTHFLNHIKKKL